MNAKPALPPWSVSLHGGHSSAYCDHASGTLSEILQEASKHYHIFGVTEHAPRLGDHLLYEEEKQMGWDVAKLEANFTAYATELATLAEAFAGRLIVLRGFETEVVPQATYPEIMLGYRKEFAFDYIVGSVHHVNEILIDGPQTEFQRALNAAGGFEALAVAYYEHVAKMVDDLKPEIVGHLDLIRKNAPAQSQLDTPAIQRAANKALEAVRDHQAILDLNTAGYRKGLGAPYPAPWLLQAAHQMEIPFCFGDDSHSPTDVGSDIELARHYLIENNVPTITALTRKDGAIVRKVIPLERGTTTARHCTTKRTPRR